MSATTRIRTVGRHTYPIAAVADYRAGMTARDVIAKHGLPMTVMTFIAALRGKYGVKRPAAPRSCGCGGRGRHRTGCNKTRTT